MDLEVGSRVGNYEIIGLLGVGGMGEVYRARDPRLDRVVALKLIAPGFSTNITWRERFRREARVLATLNHPNIATVYSAEEDHDLLALSMELVEGQSLTDLIRPGGMTADRLLKIASQIADALSAAHQKGITHRDLKPANVMIAGDARVKVLDFGLAKLAEDSAVGEMTTGAASRLTGDNHIVGTVAYMSPEQAEGGVIDYRSDIFSFGIVLYEMATGELPFKGQSVLSILSAIVRDNPAPPYEVNPRIPRQLWRVIRRCLAKDPEERYQSAKDLRNELSDLRQELSSGELTAIEIPRRRRSWQRLLGPIAIASTVFSIGWLARSYVGRDSSGWELGQITQVTFDPGIETGPTLSPDGRWIAFARQSAGRSDIYLQAVGGENAINLTKDLPDGSDQPSFSANGEHIAFRSQSQGGGIFVMGRTGELIRRVSDRGASPTWSPDGRSLAYSTSGAGDFPNAHPGGSELWVIDIETGQQKKLSVDDALQPAWSPDGKWIAYWGVDPSTHQRDLWAVSSGNGSSQRLTDDLANDLSPAWAADGQHLYFASDRGGTLNMWRLSMNGGSAAGEPEAATVPGGHAVHPTISADGTRLAYATFVRTSSVLAVSLDPATLAVSSAARWLLGGQQDWSAARISPDGRRLALVRWGQQQDLFVVNANGEGLRRLTSDRLGVRCPEWAPDGRWIAYTRGLQTEGSLVLVDSETGKVMPLSVGDLRGLGCPAWSRDGRRLAVAQAPPQSTSHIVDVPRGNETATSEALPPPHSGTFTPRSWSHDGRWLAGTIDTAVAVYSIPARTYQLVTSEGVAVGASPAYWLPGGRHILFLNPNSQLMVTEIDTKRVTTVFAVPKPQVIRGASVTSDGRQIFYAQGMEEGEIWLATLPRQH